MPKNSAQENQRDLFQEASAADPSRAESVKSFFRRRTNPMVAVSLEQIFITVVVLLILFVVVFMLGVLRGKAIRDAILTNPVAAPKKLIGSPAAYRPSRPPASNPSVKPANPAPAAKTAAEFEKNPQKPYTIQLVTYPSRGEERARKEMAELKSKGFAPRLFRRGGYIELCVGQYANRAEAEKDLRALGARYKGCFLAKKS